MSRAHRVTVALLAVTSGAVGVAVSLAAYGLVRVEPVPALMVAGVFAYGLVAFGWPTGNARH